MCVCLSIDKGDYLKEKKTINVIKDLIFGSETQDWPLNENLNHA